MIDSLEPRSRVLYRGLETLNFAMAGEGWKNRVVPTWEEVDSLEKVDYVVERLEVRGGSKLESPQPPARGCDLVFHGQAGEGGAVAEWRVWRVRR